MVTLRQAPRAALVDGALAALLDGVGTVWERRGGGKAGWLFSPRLVEVEPDPRDRRRSDRWASDVSPVEKRRVCETMAVRAGDMVLLGETARHGVAIVLEFLPAGAFCLTPEGRRPVGFRDILARVGPWRVCDSDSLEADIELLASLEQALADALESGGDLTHQSRLQSWLMGMTVQGTLSHEGAQWARRLTAVRGIAEPHGVDLDEAASIVGASDDLERESLLDAVDDFEERGGCA
jgi:hypothetical protein